MLLTTNDKCHYIELRGIHRKGAKHTSLHISRYACKEPGKSILVENDDSKELEVVDSMKLKCNNDRSWNITEKTKVKTCVCKYIQKL